MHANFNFSSKKSGHPTSSYVGTALVPVYLTLLNAVRQAILSYLGELKSDLLFTLRKTFPYITFFPMCFFPIRTYIIFFYYCEIKILFQYFVSES